MKNERVNFWIFVALVVAQAMLLASRAPVPESEFSVLTTVGMRAVGPFGRFVEAGFGGARRIAEYARLRRTLLEENDNLRQELAARQIELMRLRDAEEEVRRLSQALDFGRTSGASFRLGEVVFVDHASWLRTMLLRVPGDPVRLDQAVVSATGVLGRVIEVAGTYAKVQLVSDRATSVGAQLGGSRRQGVVRGDGRGGLELDYIPSHVPVAVGERVTTAGIDGVFPPGLPIGTVAAVSDAGELYQRILVTPAVDFARLGAVYVLDSPAPPETLRPDPELFAGRSEGGGPALP